MKGMAGKIYVPPIKTQGIKTRLVPWILDNADVRHMSADTVWVEPFMGSGVVGFNACPSRAVFADVNPHLIAFYDGIKTGDIDADIVSDFLSSEGAKLRYEREYYYEVRGRFNREHSSLDFLFLSRSCYNGLMRFNGKGEFNASFCKTPTRFTNKAYVTKIVNQVRHLDDILHDGRHDWTFICQPYEDTIRDAPNDAFVYCDPPYIERNTKYFTSWSDEDERRLCELLRRRHDDGKGRSMVSTWDSDAVHSNPYVHTIWDG